MPRTAKPERLRRRPLGRYRYVRLRWRLLFAMIDAVGAAVFGACSLVRRAVVAGKWPRDKFGRTPTGPAPLGQRFGRSAFASHGSRQTANHRHKAGGEELQEKAGGLVAKPPTTGTGPVGAGRHSPADPEGGTTNRILLIQLDHLGDAVLSTVMLGPLRRRFPEASIEVLASESNREVFASAAEVDRVHVSRVNRFARGGMAPARRLGWMLATLWWGIRLRLSGPRIDLAIDVRGDFPVAVILWLCGARRRLGWGSGGGGFLLTDRAAFVHGRAEVESRLALLALLGIEPPEDELPWRPAFRPSEAARDVASGVFAPESSWLPGEVRVVVHVGAGTPAKRWPAEHWRELIARLVSRHNARVALVGGPADEAVARSIAGPGRTPRVSNWTGRLNVDQLAAVIEAAHLFVGADSGPAHLAAAVGTPAVVLFSGTNNPRQWKPCGEAVRVLREPVPCSPCHRSRCPTANHPCMRAIAPEHVAAAVEAMARPTAAAYPEEIRP